MARRTFEVRPSRAEATAQRWHEAQHTGDGAKRCWCCCPACKRANPHRLRAVKAALADIRQRIMDSMATAVKPDRSR